MNYYFAEIKDNKVYAFHDTTSLDLVFSRDSDGLLIEISEREYMLLKACYGDIKTGIAMLRKVEKKIKKTY